MLWVSNHRAVNWGHFQRQVIRDRFKNTTITLDVIDINHCYNLIQVSLRKKITHKQCRKVVIKIKSDVRLVEECPVKSVFLFFKSIDKKLALSSDEGVGVEKKWNLFFSLFRLYCGCLYQRLKHVSCLFCSVSWLKSDWTTVVNFFFFFLVLQQVSSKVAIVPAF